MDSLDQLHHILVIEDPSLKREINLDAATYSIGRHSSNDIVLSCQKTSRNHATLLRRTDLKTNKCSYWVLDGDLQGNRSRNGIYVNGKKSLVHELKSADTIQFSADAQATYHISANSAKNTSSQQQIKPSLPPANDIVNKDTIVNPPQVSQQEVSTLKPLAASVQTSLAELSPQPIIEIDLYGNIIYINSAGIINFKDIHHQKLDHPLLANLIAKYHQGNDNIITREVNIGNKTFQQTAYYLPEKKAIRNYIVDVTAQKTLETKLQQKITLYNQITEQIAEGIIIAESATKQIVESNLACSNLLGYSDVEMLQMNVYELSNESDKFATVLKRVIAEKQDYTGDCLFKKQNGNIVNALVNISLISSEADEKICLIIKNQAESRILPDSFVSVNISERKIFNQQVITAIANAKRSQKLLAVMFCQLNSLTDIQAIIDTEKVNQLLYTLQERLKTCLRAGDTVIQWQENKFALLLPQIVNVEEVVKINQRIKELIGQSFKIGETRVNADSTIGIAIYPQDGDEGEILLASANTALERARQNKKSYQFYDEAMNSQALVALEMEALLKQGLDRQEFRLYYQPQINVDTGKLEAIEALLRWQHPELGLVTPTNFIKSAEKSKLIIPIGEWAIRQACSQNKAWQSQGLPSAKITVSLSSVQFQQPDLTQKIAEILAETALEPQLLELEISAISLMENVDHSNYILNQLHSLGVHIAVDSFTAGFSTLEYLKQFPLNTLKIDRFLVQQLTDNPQDLAIIAALIELGEGFNLRVVAEGVETQEQVDLLCQLNCQQMQGYWFGRPLAADEASKLLQICNHPENLEITESSEQEISEDTDSIIDHN